MCNHIENVKYTPVPVLRTLLCLSTATQYHLLTLPVSIGKCFLSVI
jgi:hypothetical protein